MATQPAERVPLQARSVATRAALLDAALECLTADGYASVTTNEIARRAGVSRGALLHHFPAKADLLAAAVEHLLSRRLREFQALVETVEPDAIDVDALVDLVWSLFDGPAFIAWVELWVAARTDDDLAATIVEVERRFTDESRQLAVAVLATFGPNEAGTFEMARDFVFAVMNGVALERLVPRGQRPASDYLDVLKPLIRSMLQADSTRGRR